MEQQDLLGHRAKLLQRSSLVLIDCTAGNSNTGGAFFLLVNCRCGEMDDIRVRELNCAMKR